MLDATLALVFAVLFACVGLALLLHHGAKHMYDSADSLAQVEGLHACCFFQPHDVANHETWILVCWTNAVTLFIVAAVAQT